MRSPESPQSAAGRLSVHPLLRDLGPEELAQLTRAAVPLSAPAGETLIRQGSAGDGLYFLLSGQLAVYVERGPGRQPVAHIHPPGTVGELSFVTGRPCIADVEVVVDAELLHLPAAAAEPGSALRRVLLGCLTPILAERLSSTTLSGAQSPDAPCVLLLPGPNWPAPGVFAPALAASYARQHGRRTLLVHCGDDSARGVPGVARAPEQAQMVEVMAWAAPRDTGSWRAALAPLIAEWKGRFDAVFLSPAGLAAAACAEAIAGFANVHGYLQGPGDPLPDARSENSFVVQCDSAPTLSALDCSHQLIRDAADAEAAWISGRPLPGAFLRTVDSMARCVAGTQIGLALGGGAAWGWAHAGVLAALDDAGFPVDAVAGCSMGSVMGALYASGYDGRAICDLARFWSSRTRRFLEWRLWRLALLNDKAVRTVFASYFGGRRIERLHLPYRANTVDLQSAREMVFSDGPLVDCLRASVSLPGLLPPVERGQALLVDAAIANPVPARVARSMGCRFVLGVNAMAELRAQPVRRRYPRNVFEVLTRCMFLMGHEIGDARAEPAADIVFTPALDDIAMMQFERSSEIVARGREAAESHLPGIRSAYAAWIARRGTHGKGVAAS